MSAIEKFMRLQHNATFGEALAALKESGTASLKIVIRGQRDTPLAAMIVVAGKAESTEVVAAVDAIEERWHEQKPEPQWFVVYDEQETAIATFPEEELAKGYRGDLPWKIHPAPLNVPALPKGGA